MSEMTLEVRSGCAMMATMTRRIFVDTEWTAPPWSESSELLSLGLADEAGATWSAVAAEVDLGPLSGSSVVALITADQPRLTSPEMSAEVAAFCGDVDEFWAWIPTEESVAAWFGLDADEAPELFARHWDVDLQHLQALVQPWPERWPTRLSNLRVAAEEAGVELPPRRPDHLNPRVHAEWNRELFERIRRSGDT